MPRHSNDTLADDDFAGLKNFASGFAGGMVGRVVAGKKGMVAGTLLAKHYDKQKRVVSRIELIINISNCNIYKLRIEVFNSQRTLGNPYTDADDFLCSSYIRDAKNITERIDRIIDEDIASSTRSQPITIEL